MATTIKGKTTVGAKTRSTSKIKSRGRGQTKIGKPARKPKNRKVKARVGAGALKRKSNKGGVGPTPSLPPSVASGGLEFWAPTIELGGRHDGQDHHLEFVLCGSWLVLIFVQTKKPDNTNHNEVRIRCRPPIN